MADVLNNPNKKQSEPCGRACIGWTVAFFLSLSAFVASICGWMTTPVWSGVLWPSDIQVRVVKMLGGDAAITLAGQNEYSLSWMAVAFRVVLVLLAAGGLRAILKRSPRENFSGWTDFARRSSILFIVSLSWWGIWLFADMGLMSAGKLALGLLPVWLMGTLAAAVWLMFRFALGLDLESNFQRDSKNISSESDSAEMGKRPWNGPWVILFSAVVVWVAISFWLNWLLYKQLMVPHGDSAMYEEHLWNIWHGKGFRSYLDQGLFLGEHIQVIHLLLLPIHRICPSHLVLEFSESLALGSCSLIIYAIAFRQTKSPSAAMWCGLAWLCYFPMHFLDIAIDQKTFRPIVLGLPFLFGMIYYSENGKIWKTAICLVLALSAKEDVALIACPLLVILAIRQEWSAEKASSKKSLFVPLLVLSAATAVYLILAVLVVIPAFRSGEHVHYARYFGELGNTPGELIRTALSDPSAVIFQAVSVQTVVYLAVFLVPLALLPLKRAWLLLAGSLTFAMLSLLQFSTDAADLPPVPYHHFHAPLLPVIFWAMICAIGSGVPLRLGQENASHKVSAKGLASLAFCCCMTTAITGSLSPMGATFWSEESSFGFHQLYRPKDTVQILRASSIDPLIDQIPRSARVAATDYVHTRLTHWERSYDYSDYLRAVNDYQAGVPDDTDFIVLDLTHPYSRIRKVEDVRELKQRPFDWLVRDDLSNECFLVLERSWR